MFCYKISTDYYWLFTRDMASGAIKKAQAAHKRERKELAKQKKQAKDEKRAREYEERKRCASPPPNACLTTHA